LIQQFALPHPRLRHLIDRYWCWCPDVAGDMPALLPGTGAELWFHLADPPRHEEGAVPSAHLVAARASNMQLRPGRKTHLLAVRFRNAGLFSLFGVPLDELIDQLVPLDALLPQHQTSQPGLDPDADWSAQVQVLDHWLLGLLAAREQDAFSTLVERHYYLRDCSHGYGSKHFQRLFRRYTGISARRFLRLRRFQLITRQLLLAQRTDYLDSVLAEGYYDQAHFIRDFRELAGQTPGRFLVPQNFRQHFYQPSLVES